MKSINTLLGQRVIKTIGSNKTYFSYDESGKLIGEYDGNNNPIREYIYLNNQPIALISNERDDEVLQIHTDHLGTPRVVTDKNKSVLWRMEGDQFGNVQPQIEKIKLPLRHAGQYADDESGLFYNYFRYYNPNMGRYIENDPIGLEGGINTYGYVAGSPLMGIDFYGLSPRDVKKIKNAINKSILDMTNKGERINGGYKNNACRRYPILSKMWVDCGKNPDKLKDCGDQVDTTLVEIKKNNFDDVWTCNYDSGTGHAWGFCVARTNKTDPIIWFDPRANQISEDKPCASCHPYLYLPPLYGEKYIKNLQGDLQ